MFTCWKISTLWLMLWVSDCQPARWTLSNTGIDSLRREPGRVAQVLSCCLHHHPAALQPIPSLGIIVINVKDRSGESERFTEDLFVWISTLPKRCQIKVRCRRVKLSESHWHSLWQLCTFHWELNHRRCPGSCSWSHSSHLGSPAD